MSTVPNLWVVLKITGGPWKDHDATTVYKVLGSWAGGYLYGDSWRMNSGIKSVRIEPGTTEVAPDVAVNDIIFEGYSGSEYCCSARGYGMTGYVGGILAEITRQIEERGGTVEVMPEDTDWTSLDYEGKLPAEGPQEDPASTEDPKEDPKEDPC